MNVAKTQTLNYGAILVPPVYYQQVPAVVRHIKAEKIQTAAKRLLPEVSLTTAPIRENFPHRDMLIFHEAILPDDKIRVVGIDKAITKDFPIVRKLKEAGRKNYQRIWSKR